MLIFLQSTKFLSLPPTKVVRIAELSNRFWLGGITLSLLSGAAGLVRVRKEANRLALVIDEKIDGDRTKAKVLGK